MKVYILIALPITDVSGELLDSGGIISVRSTEEAATKDFNDEVAKGGFRKSYDYEIEEKEVK